MTKIVKTISEDDADVPEILKIDIDDNENSIDLSYVTEVNAYEENIMRNYSPNKAWEVEAWGSFCMMRFPFSKDLEDYLNRRKLSDK